MNDCWNAAMRLTPAVCACLMVTLFAACLAPQHAADTSLEEWVSAPAAKEGVDESASENGRALAAQEVIPEIGLLEFRPKVLNLNSSGRYVTCLLVLPEGRTVRDVFIPSIQLNGAVYASTEFSPHNPVVEYQNKDELMLKFEKYRVQEVLSPGHDVAVWVSGWFTDSVPFVAHGSVTIIA